MTDLDGTGPGDHPTSGGSARQRVCRLLAERTGTRPQDWFPVFKARYGMQVVFDRLRTGRGGGDVLTQIFTCATAVDPILCARLRPVYADVSPATIALDPARLQVGTSTRAVVAQHTFGIIDHEQTARLQAAAREVGALLVEDSCHCVGRVARGADGAPLADVSIHSFGVEKVLPTRFGGAVWVNPQSGDRALRRQIADALAGLPVVARRVDVAARLYRSQVRVLNRLPGSAARPLRDTMTRLGLFEPPIAPAETAGGLPYPPSRPSDWMLNTVAAPLGRLDRIEAERGAAVTRYHRALGDLVQIPAGVRPGDPLVRFPFLVPTGVDPEGVIDALTRAGHYPGRWYRPALFPGASDPALFGYRPGDQAVAVSEELISKVVNLPTAVPPDRARAIAEVVTAQIAGAASRT